MFRIFCTLLCLGILISCSSDSDRHTPSTLIGKFDISKDLLLLHFDSKTDVDDIHSIAGAYTMLTSSKLSAVNYHAVAGAYGIQEGLYVPANELFVDAFRNNWSDAHNDYDKAISEVAALATQTLTKGGSIWIAEAGQSDFSADLVRKVLQEIPNLNSNSRIHIIQHSNWNEEVTTPEDLEYVNTTTDYQKIPDGNRYNNGTPGLRSEEVVNWQQYITKPAKVAIWEQAIAVANEYNAKDGRYNNEAIASGGLDFSDVSEICWIFGYEHLENADAFFSEFGDVE